MSQNLAAGHRRIALTGCARWCVAARAQHQFIEDATLAPEHQNLAVALTPVAVSGGTGSFGASRMRRAHAEARAHAMLANGQDSERVCDPSLASPPFTVLRSQCRSAHCGQLHPCLHLRNRFVTPSWHAPSGPPAQKASSQV